jgi:hypothetical protein
METPALEVEASGYSWLDKIIEEQAAYYGMPVDRHNRLMSDAAQYDEDHPEL